MGGLLRRSEKPRMAPTPSDPELDSLIARILSAEKEISGDMRWSSAGRADTATCRLRVICREYPRAYLRLILTINRRKLPQKAGFSLLLGDKRVFSLDVEPRRWHNNGAGLGSVRVTHWSAWPCDKVDADDRRLSHREWFAEFVDRSRSKFAGRYRKPPYEPEQLKLI